MRGAREIGVLRRDERRDQLPLALAEHRGEDQRQQDRRKESCRSTMRMISASTRPAHEGAVAPNVAPSAKAAAPARTPIWIEILRP